MKTNVEENYTVANKRWGSHDTVFITIETCSTYLKGSVLVFGRDVINMPRKHLMQEDLGCNAERKHEDKEERKNFICR